MSPRGPVSAAAVSGTLPLLLSLVAAAAVSADVGAAPPRDWVVQSRSQDPGRGHVLYSRPRPGSSSHEYRMEITLDAPPKDVMPALVHNVLDPDTYPKGFRREVLRREEGLIVSHDYIAVPFISDRDVVMRTETGRDPSTGLHRMTWASTREEGPPPRAGVVRMPRSEGSWTLHPHGEDGTLAVYESYVELGGSLPSAFVQSRMPDEIIQQGVQLRRTMRARRLAQR